MEKKSVEIRDITMRNVVDFLKSLTIAESAKLSGAIIAVVSVIGGIGYSAASIKTNLVEDSKTAHQDKSPLNVQPTSEKKPMPVVSEMPKIDQAELEALKSENAELKQKLKARPSSYVCNVVWGGRLDELKKKKEALAEVINWKLNPIPPKGYQDYSEEQKITFIEQVKQHRFESDDMQREIIEIEKNRGTCIE